MGRGRPGRGICHLLGLDFFLFSSLVKSSWMGVEVPHQPKFSTSFSPPLYVYKLLPHHHKGVKKANFSTRKGHFFYSAAWTLQPSSHVFYVTKLSGSKRIQANTTTIHACLRYKTLDSTYRWRSNKKNKSMNRKYNKIEVIKSLIFVT